MSIFPTWAYFEASEVKQTSFVFALILDYVRQDNFVYTAQKDTDIRSINLKYISDKWWVNLGELKDVMLDVAKACKLKSIWIDDEAVFYFKYNNNDEENNRD